MRYLVRRDSPKHDKYGRDQTAITTGSLPVVEFDFKPGKSFRSADGKVYTVANDGSIRRQRT